MASVARNPRLLAAHRGLHMSLFPVSVLTLFWKHDIGMSMSEILLLQGLFGLVMALFEFPSGYLADRLGYGRSLALAAALGVVGWSAYAVAHSLAGVALAEAVLGVSYSLVSGCDSALLYESLREQGREETFARWTGRVRFWGQTGEGSAALAAGVLYVWDPALPFMVQAGVCVVNLGVALALVEPSRSRPPPGNHLRQIRGMLRHAFIDDRTLTSVMVLTTVLGLASFVPVWLVPLYATGAGVPEAWIGPIWAAANYCVAVGSLVSDRLVRRVGLITTVGLCVALVAAGYAGLALSYGLFGFAWYFALTVMRGLFGPALLHQENRLIPSSDRAGFISLRSLVFRLSFLALAPAVGWGVDAHGQHPVLAALGLGLVVSATLAWRWFARRLQRAAPPDHPAV